MESIEELRVELKGDVGRWEEEILNWAYELARSVAKVLLEKMDEELMKGREEGLKVEGLKERGVTTLFGRGKNSAPALSRQFRELSLSFG